MSSGSNDRIKRRRLTLASASGTSSSGQTDQGATPNSRQAYVVDTPRYIERELARLTRLASPDFGASLIGDDIFRWRGHIIGPAGSPYEGAVFFLFINFRPTYPAKPATVNFNVRDFYHPNIDKFGGIGLDLLHTGIWTPVRKLMEAIRELLSKPRVGPGDDEQVLQPLIADEYRNDHPLFLASAKSWTEEYKRKKWPV